MIRLSALALSLLSSAAAPAHGPNTPPQAAFDPRGVVLPALISCQDTPERFVHKSAVIPASFRAQSCGEQAGLVER